jgi:hypothetical protein
MKHLALCLLLASPATALASCPTAADLDGGGIRLSVSGGDTELFRRVSEDIVASIFETRDGLQSLTLLGRGMYVLRIAEMDAGDVVPDSDTTYDFDMPAGSLPMPGPQEDWTVDVGVDDHGFSSHELQSYRFGPMTEVGLGGCTYDMIPVIQSYDPDPYEVTDFVNWLPELGISYLVRSSHAHGDQRSSYTAIEAMP